MPDESLGHIDIRFPSGGGGGGAAGGGGGAAPQKREKEKFDVNIFKEANDLFRKAASGGSISEGRAAIGRLSEGSAGGLSAGATGLLGAAVGIGVTVAAVSVAIRSIASAVQGIMERITQLARYSPTLALEAMLTKLQEMRQDISEAKILGPLYQVVAQMYRQFMSVFQPIFLAIKVVVTTILASFLGKIYDITKSLLPAIMQIVESLRDFMQSIADIGNPDAESQKYHYINGVRVLNQDTVSDSDALGIKTLFRYVTQTLKEMYVSEEDKVLAKKSVDALNEILEELKKKNAMPTGISNSPFIATLNGLTHPAMRKRPNP